MSVWVWVYVHVCDINNNGISRWMWQNVTETECLCKHLMSYNQQIDQCDTVPVSDIKKAVREVWSLQWMSPHGSQLWNTKKYEERKKLSNSVWRHNLDSFQCSLRESSIKTPFKIILAVGLQFTCSSMQRWDHVHP